MNDTVIIQQATGSHIYMLNLTVQEHAAYCHKWGMDYIPTYGNPGDDEHSYWQKVRLLKQYVLSGRYKNVIWLDADCYISDHTKDLRNACHKNSFAMTWHDDPTWDEAPDVLYDHWNCGAIYIGVGISTEDAIKDWYSFKDNDDGHPWHDQHVFNKVLIPYWEEHVSGFPIKKLSHKYNSTPFYQDANPIVMAWHGVLRDLGERIVIMQEAIRRVNVNRMLSGSTQEEATQKAMFCEQTANLGDALRFWDKAIEVGPVTATLLRCKSNCLVGMHRWADAIPVAEKALEISDKSDNAEDATLYRVIASCYDFLGEPEKLEPMIQSAQQLGPWAPATMHNLSLHRLRHGDFDWGFANMEWGRMLGRRVSRCIGKEWDSGFHNSSGKDNTGTVFVYAEQGIGDVIMYLRYVPNLFLYFSKVVLEVHVALFSLVKEAFSHYPGIKVVEVTNDLSIHEEYDEWVGIISLPSALNKKSQTDAVSDRYICIDGIPPAHPQNPAKKRIGFSWAGSHAHGNNINRNTEAKYFDRLIDMGGFDWVCLQHGIVIPEEVRADNPDIEFAGENHASMMDTAITLKGLDLIITIDSAIAHLAGAMGIPCWIILSKSSDWRWLLNTNTTLWYASVILYRQTTLGDWDGVFDAVKTDLEKMING